MQEQLIQRLGNKKSNKEKGIYLILLS